ncbi:triphosphoribosyl-dephospho-CoA synthase [Clostridium transplantifaecale]|uniref:triphosphoribosyl-dephospho-CoA synthase n=1 Tax=Clostridium transplantifaecale TaxID=2479838 RepID=UPI000F6331AC|nr:triphosphoribosyl-dephospho-CoA synthase [Clostridium transplantifaecale]
MNLKKAIGSREFSVNLMRKQFLDALECAAGRSLTDEVEATPKPGLVDLKDSGAHKDMDYRTFKLSIEAILPFIREMAEIGIHHGAMEEETGPQSKNEPDTENAEQLFAAIRPAGVRAEKAMFSATGGVNTHKGIIFSMGILAAATGRFWGRRLLCPGAKAEELLSYCSLMCHRPMERDFSAVVPGKDNTHGELLYLKYGCRGIRGEAADGFPAVRYVGLPALREYFEYAKLSGVHPGRNQLSLHILLHLMANVDDTNVLFRTNYESLEYVKQCALSVLSLGGSKTDKGMEALTRLNKDFTVKNISPGGCADLLSMTLFLWRIESLFHTDNGANDIDRNFRNGD